MQPERNLDPPHMSAALRMLYRYLQLPTPYRSQRLRKGNPFICLSTLLLTLTMCRGIARAIVANACNSAQAFLNRPLTLGHGGEPHSRAERRECAAGGRGRPRVTYDVTAALNAIGICVFLADIYVEVSLALAP